MPAEADPRPRPQYGEYADEPPVAQQSAEPEGQGASPHAPVPPQQPQQLQSPPPAGGYAAPVTPSHRTPVPGVPHNLGVTGGTGQTARPAARTGTPVPPPVQPPSHAAPQQQQQQFGQPGAQGDLDQTSPGAHGEPYRADPPPGFTAPQQAQQQAPQHVPQQHAPQFQQPAATAQPLQSAPAQVPQKPTNTDRVITILLLGLGTLGAFYLGFSLLQLPSQFQMAANIFGIEGFVVPAAVKTIGTAGAISILSLYALSLLFTIQRLRARKLAFWVPLAAGAVSVLILFALTLIAYTQSPELVQAMSQPDAFEKLMQFEGQ